MTSNGALSDLVVLECGQGIGAAFTAKAFADLGAEVVKVEPPAGDPARRHGPFPEDVPHPERSGQFLYLNANKLGITLNLDTAQGRQILDQLAQQADILLTDLPPARLDELDLSYPCLAERNPRLILTAISPFGQTGPYRDFKGSDLIAWQMGGTGYATPWAGVTNPAAEPPLRGGGYQAEYLSGWTAAAATMAAVFHRLTYGVGQLVDVSAMEAAANMMRPSLAMYTHHPPGVAKDRLKITVPWIYPCKDGYVSTSVLRDHWWAALQDLPGRPDWADTPALATGPERRQHLDVLDTLLIEWFSGHTRAFLYRELQSRGIPGFPVNSIGEAVHAPQFTARGFFVEQHHPVAGTILQPGPSMRLSATPWQLRRPAPLLGEHNEEVLCNALGYTAEDVDRLRTEGVV
ncbi:MAG: CoA transferase [Chloroflexi bacterium]|nr:CoA transferase [Chloroflexota bacterium]